VAFQFERKGEIFYKASAGDPDTVMLAALEAGAEDVESDEDGHWITTGEDDLGTVSAALEESLGESETAKFVWRPKVTTPVEGEAFEKLMRLIEVLEDDDDVQSVTTNMETSEEAMAAYAAS
jgi:transcriptional/translational regulatory protein YebC/TACO1